jgi:hypothetical protein
MAENEAARQDNQAVVTSILPDICLTPVGSAVKEVAYTITATLKLGTKLALSVKMTDQYAFTMQSRIDRCKGNEAGTKGGIHSGVNLGWCRPVTHTWNTKTKGWPMVLHTSLFAMNCATEDSQANTIGKLTYIKSKGVESSYTITADDVAAATDQWDKMYNKDRVNRGLWDKVTPEFEKRVREVAADLGVKPSDLMACINFETFGTFSSNIQVTTGGSAIGLIQFIPRYLPDTARTLLGGGDNAALRSALASQTPVQQLDIVKAFLQQPMFTNKIKDVGDLYMAIHYPKAVGKPGDFVLYETGSAEYTQNSGLDANGDGKVTKDEATARVRQEAKRQEDLDAANTGGVKIAQQ